MSSPQIIGVGAATLDHFHLVAEFPSQEGVQPSLRSLRSGGGPVATALCVLSHLGSAAALLDSQGDDWEGTRIRDELDHFGVETSFVRIREGALSAHAAVLVRQRDGARHIVFTPSTAGELQPADVPESLFKQARLLHLNGRHEATAFRAIELAGQNGVTISFDGGAGRFRGEASLKMLAASRIRIVARSFARDCCGCDDVRSQGDALWDSETEVLVITDGAAGSYVWEKKGTYFHQPACKAEPLIDTTGCGDVFHGAFLHGCLQGWPLARAAAFASEKAARNAEGLGGRHVLFSR